MYIWKCYIGEIKDIDDYDFQFLFMVQKKNASGP